MDWADYYTAKRYNSNDIFENVLEVKMGSDEGFHQTPEHEATLPGLGENRGLKKAFI
ncbi:hypothetical protein DET50_1121 [Marinobacter pelagius]|uniref:Uncharacterized protein n=1 Tax=Marinobacter pelagius TaxID=379482 RepID=A0A366GNR6_9GAMM|nr:hypothetical protein [Marinobacter pelagius]RBP28272.1 hypothetical protein DET50_1121 [Marinobacter pelagius]